MPRHVCVLLDEAYCEFNTLDDPDTTLDLLAHHPNLVLLRTFSKVYGLAGLRVGFALCGSAEPVAAVDRVRQPFFCSAPAQAAAIEALRHQDAVAERVERARGRAHRARGRARARSAIGVAASQANFCWLDAPGEPRRGAAARRAARRRRAARARRARARRARRSGAPGCLRVTYGPPDAERALPRGARRRARRVALAVRRSATHALAPPQPCGSMPSQMSREAHSATTYPTSAALSGFGFAYRYAWRFS